MKSLRIVLTDTRPVSRACFTKSILLPKNHLFLHKPGLTEMKDWLCPSSSPWTGSLWIVTNWVVGTWAYQTWLQRWCLMWTIKTYTSGFTLRICDPRSCRWIIIRKMRTQFHLTTLFSLGLLVQNLTNNSNGLFTTQIHCWRSYIFGHWHNGYYFNIL